MSTVEFASSEKIAGCPDRVPGETCPRCHTTQPWEESSWCPNCSYYPVVDGSATDGCSWADALPEIAEEATEDDLSPLESIPMWFWWMLAGVIGITTISVVIRLTFPDEDSPRGIIALTQLAVGLVTMITAHGIASKFALKNDRRLNFNDIVLSWFNIWQPTIAELPATCRRVLAMVWGGFAALTAVTIIGGIDYSAPFRVHQQPDIKPIQLIAAVAAAARSQEQGDTATMVEALQELQSQTAAMQEGNGMPKTMEEALEELGDMQEQLEGQAVPDVEADVDGLQTYTLNCFIYGVETDRKGVPKAFLFAANTQGKDQHVARLKREDLPDADFRTIVVQLYVAAQSKPEIETDRTAVWVKPIVSCRLAFKGFSETGELKEPEFGAILVKQKGRLDVYDSEGQTPVQRR